VKKRILAAAGAIAISAGLSGCIAFTGFHWTDDMPKPGKTTTGLIESRGIDSGSEPAEAYFYVSINGEGDGFTLKKFTFDAGDAIGEKGKMVADDTIEDYSSGECSPVSGGAIYRTQVQVSSAPLNKLIQTKFKVKIDDAGGGFGGIVSTGQWYDDGDGVAEDPTSSGDTYTCTGSTSTVMGSKGFDFPSP
jgi:hypothetical protein